MGKHRNPWIARKYGNPNKSDTSVRDDKASLSDREKIQATYLCFRVPDIPEELRPYLKEEVGTKIPILDVHSKSFGNLSVSGRGFDCLAWLVDYCCENGISQFIVIHGQAHLKRGVTKARKRRTWLFQIRRTFGFRSCKVSRKNKGVTLVHLKLKKMRRELPNVA